MNQINPIIEAFLPAMELARLDALRDYGILNAAPEWQFDAKVPPILTEKHKVLQILVNLIRNAKHACEDSETPDEQSTLRVANGNGHIKASVPANGIGISAEYLTGIFSHGFTTRKNGHGVGLHSGALVAKEIGKNLIAFSVGLGSGATFTLELLVQKSNP